MFAGIKKKKVSQLKEQKQKIVEKNEKFEQSCMEHLLHLYSIKKKYVEMQKLIA